MKHVAGIVLLSHCLWTAAARGEQIVLARGGRPAATIVTPADPHPRLRRAAEELQEYVARICGVRLPVRHDGERVEGTGLYIGRCQLTGPADLPGEELNPETYAIRLRQGNVLFTGRWPTPTYFAVVSFIEQNLGVRWFAPGRLWEYVPEGEPGELVVEVSDVVKEPDTSPRIWSGHAWFPPWELWNLRNKTVESEVVPRRQFQNFIHRVFPPAEYARQHPEYYPLIDGKRWIPTGGARWRPCESNPDVVRLTVQYARRWFDAHPQVDSFSLGMDDITHLCGCPACRAMDASPDAYQRREFSDRHYKFVNAVARQIRRTHPDRYIGTLIYNVVRQPPKTVLRLEDNVFGFITERSALWWQEGRKEADHQLTREWARRAKHLSRYDYYGMGCLTPRFYPHTMAEQMRFDKSLGLEGMYVEVYTFLPHTAPMIWALAKLQWDHTLDIDQLLEEFYAKMYAQAAPLMRRYFDLLERSWNTPRPGRTGWVHRDIVAQALATSPEDVYEGLRLLERATKAAGDARASQRIEIHRSALEYSAYVVFAYALSEKLLALDVRDQPSADEALGLIEKLADLSARRRRFWDQARRRNDLLGETLRGLSEKVKYLPLRQIGRVEHGGPAGAMKVLAWYASRQRGQLQTAAERLRRTGHPTIRQTAEAWLWIHNRRARNLLENPGFESIAGGRPRAWSTWSRTPRAAFGTARRKGQDGSIAATITGAESACFTQRIPARPGQRYLCLVWVKADPQAGEGRARLTVRFRDTNGRWHKDRDSEPSATVRPSNAGWQPLAVLVHTPTDTAALVVMLSAAGQGISETLLLDNAALYPLPRTP